MALCMSACYKNPKFSDVTVQIWQQCETPDSPRTPPSTAPIDHSPRPPSSTKSRTHSHTSSSTHLPDSLNGANTFTHAAPDTSTSHMDTHMGTNLVLTGTPGHPAPPSPVPSNAGMLPSYEDTLLEEFPGHKVVFYAVSEYYKAMFEWDELNTICFKVQEHQAQAAQALVYYAYHHSLPDGMSLVDAGQLLVLADRYQMEGCVSLCVKLLEQAVDGGNDLEATLEVCRVLGHIGMVSPAVEGFFALFKKHSWQLRAMFARRLVPARGVSMGKKGGYTSFQHAVDVLRSVFQDMERIWTQEEFRQILHLFPMEVVKAVLEWDHLSPASENTIVAAIHDWMLAQPDVPDQQALKEEEALLSVVRIPFLSPSYLSQVFPSLFWVQTHTETASNMLMYGTYAALSLNRLPAEAISNNLPQEMRYMVHPRQYRMCPTEVRLEWDTPWELVHGAKMIVDKTHSCSELHGPKAWVNGVRVGLYIRVNPPMRVAEGKVGNAAVTGYWAWQAPTPKSRKGGETCVMATYEIKFEHVMRGSVGADRTDSESESERVREDERVGKLRHAADGRVLPMRESGDWVMRNGDRMGGEGQVPSSHRIGVEREQAVGESLGAVTDLTTPGACASSSRRTSMEVDMCDDVLDDAEDKDAEGVGERMKVHEREQSAGQTTGASMEGTGFEMGEILGQQSGHLASSRFFTRTGICELFRTYPDNVDQMMRAGHVLRCSLTISEIM